MNRLTFLGRIATSPLRPLPDFLVIGAMRAGTTSFYHWLCSSPTVTEAYRKEVHYFDHAAHRGLWWYRAFFPIGADITGEATPELFSQTPDAPQRVRDVLGERTMLIALLRDPVERAISHYWIMIRAGKESRPISDALDPAGDNYDGYLTRGLYGQHLDRWHAAGNCVKVLFLEELIRAPHEVCRTVIDELSIDAPQAPFPKMHGAARQDVPEWVRSRLSDFYAEDRLLLAKRLNRALPEDWS